jgi:integrase
MPKAKYRKRKDGRYYTNVDIGHDENGKRLRVSVYGRTIEEIDNNILKLKQDVKSGTHVKTSTTSFKQYSDRFLKEKEISSEAQTYLMYAQIVSKYGADLADRKLTAITRQDIQRIINENRTKPRTCEKIKIVFNCIFEKALIDGLIGKNPCKGLELPRYQAAEKRPLTDTEKILLRISDFTDKQRVFLLIGQYYGLRKSEIIALRKDSFDFNKNLIFVNRATEFIHEKPREKDTKNHETRTLRLIPAHADQIRKYIQSLPKDNDPHIFRCEDTDDWMDQSSFRRMWNQIIQKMTETAKENGLPAPQNLTCHVLRHEFCTSLYYMGIDLREAQRLTGHKTLTVLSDIYVHLDNAKRDPRDRMIEYYQQEEIRQQKALEAISKKNSQPLS